LALEQVERAFEKSTKSEKVSQRAEAKDQRTQRPTDQEARREVDSQE
jgi:hypothetical protein